MKFGGFTARQIQVQLTGTLCITIWITFGITAQWTRTAWLDSGLRDYPLAATYSNNLVNQEEGVDDNELGASTPIHAYASTAEFDLDDGHQFNFIWRVLPDITFDGSTTESPSAVMTLVTHAELRVWV